MDPVMTTYNIACALVTWINHVKERRELAKSISRTLAQICALMAPFQLAKNLDPAILQACKAMGEAICCAKQHLMDWDEQRSKSINRVLAWVDPARVTKILQEDERELIKQLQMMTMCVTTAGYFRSQPIPSEGRSAWDYMPEGDVMRFWRDFIGVKVLWVSHNMFFEALRACYGNDLDPAAFHDFISRLDEGGTGGVTPSSLQRSIGNGMLSHVVEKYKVSVRIANAEVSLVPRIPLLLWVDDQPEGNREAITYARSLGVTVLELTSTASAIAWLEAHQEFVRNHDVANRIRFISDNVRIESDPRNPSMPPQPNVSAGRDITHYLRCNSYRAPMLVYCGTIESTQYIPSYEAAGSTTHLWVVQQYIECLARGIGNDGGWMGYNAVGMVP